MTNTFIKGMDVSTYPEMMDLGYKYYDYDGKEVNLFDFAVSQGFNYGRLRIWNEPDKVPQAKGYCDIHKTISMAKEFKKRGMGFLLDFHYSDWYADPGTQTKPVAWEGLNHEELIAAVYDYTKSVLSKMDDEGVYPEMVQIGNEIRCGMIWPEGKTSNWPMLARLINAGIKAVRDTQKERDTKVMLHLDQGRRYYYLEEWFDNCLAHGVTDFDIIGLSFYAFWHGGYNDAKNAMEKLSARYDKPIILAEVAHGYKVIKDGLYDEPQEKLSGFPTSAAGQRAVMELEMCMTANISNHRGLGVFYWEPFCMPGGMDHAWASSMSLVDDKGKAMEGVKAFGVNPYELDATEYVKLYEPNEINITEDMAGEIRSYLPDRIKALRMDGNIDRLPITWDNNMVLTSGYHEVCGICNGETVTAMVKVVDDVNRVNLVSNPTFNDGLENWNIRKQDWVEVQIREKIADELPYDTYNYLYIKGNEKFLFDMSQKIKVNKAGKYHFSLFFMGDNTTGVKVEMYVMIGDRKVSRSIFPEEVWHEHQIEFEITDKDLSAFDNGIDIALKMDSPISFGAVKNVKLTCC